MAKKKLTPEQIRAEDVKKGDHVLARITDEFVMDSKGNVKPGPAGPSIFDVGALRGGKGSR